ncbi:hypothetical protein FDP41_005238 [Naegleria fowleri]|uniref:PCI domain-containing protein n=1 Tax=Naegleria fowleri TaxID=5763 RepID=A0A6A5BNQ9_NAEFO|nr:uncharacterized protein FDP41_005238 [Naegleria fowleri]KAF0975911.1 hypothetical protein FDP41_005238 [Naegleria fowleri]CAG4709092.1 unnamed protein product [Naegleria fowleri]
MAQTPEQAIEQFLLLGKSVKGKAAVNLIQQAINHPNTFVFSEMLDLKGIKELDGSEHQADFNTLKLFAFGTYGDYKSNPSNYFPLSDKNSNKLKQLSIVTLASKNRLLKYEDLMKDLDISNVRELEDLLIDCMYQGLLEGKLDQKYKCMEVYETIGRDIKMEDIDQMISILKNWVVSGKEILKGIDSNIEYANNQFKVHNENKKKFEQQIAQIEETIKASLEEDTSSAGMMGMMSMMGMLGAARMGAGGAGGAGGSRTRKNR